MLPVSTTLINPRSADFRSSKPFIYTYGKAVLGSPAKILFFMVFTDRALLLDLDSPPQGPGSTFRATDINQQLQLRLIASKPLLPVCQEDGCFGWMPELPPPCSPHPLGWVSPASLLLAFGETSDVWPVAKCWSLASRVKTKATFKSKYKQRGTMLR